MKPATADTVSASVLALFTHLQSEVGLTALSSTAGSFRELDHNRRNYSIWLDPRELETRRSHF